jgi:hypothetical protein
MPQSDRRREVQKRQRLGGPVSELADRQAEKSAVPQTTSWSTPEDGTFAGISGLHPAVDF